MIGESEIKKGMEAAKEVGRRASQAGGSVDKAVKEVSDEATNAYLGQRGGV